MKTYNTLKKNPNSKSLSITLKVLSEVPSFLYIIRCRVANNRYMNNKPVIIKLISAVFSRKYTLWKKTLWR